MKVRIKLGPPFFVAILLLLVYLSANTSQEPDFHSPANEYRGETASVQRELASTITALSKSSERWRKVKIGLMTVAGVLALLALVFEMKQDEDTNRLADTQNRLAELVAQASHVAIEEARERASAANERAAEANARAKEAEVLVASADAASKSAVSRVAAAEARIAEANRAAAEANAVAEKERLARLQLEIRLSPRTLTSDQQRTLVQRLTEAGGVPANVVIFGDTHEIQTIGRLLLDCLAKSGWTLGVQRALGGGGSVQGIVVGVSDDADERTHKAAKILISQLQGFGIASGPWDFNEMPFPGTSVGSAKLQDAKVMIFVGTKP